MKTLAEIAEEIRLNCPSLKHFDCYFFGSAVTGCGADIDLLLVGPDRAELKRLKSELAIVGKDKPLHLLFMLPDEAAETGFVDLENCVPLCEV